MLSAELTLLMQGRAILSDPKKWTQAYSARDEEGKPVTATHPEATCWCSSGLLQYLSPSNYLKAENLLEEDLFYKTSNWYNGQDIPTIEEFNDHSTYEEVLALWDYVIAKRFDYEQSNPT